jgi:hypothetical protein
MIKALVPIARKLAPSMGSNIAQSVGSNMAPSMGSNIAQSVGSNTIRRAFSGTVPNIAPSMGSNIVPSVFPNMTPNFFTRVTPYIPPTPVSNNPAFFQPPPESSNQTDTAKLTPEDVLKFMQSNPITTEDLEKITSNPELVENVERAVKRAFDKQSSVNWKEMREIQNRAYQAFNKINVFAQAWQKFVEEECASRLTEDQDKCFAIRGFAYISFMVFLIILKMVDSHNKKVKVSDSELVNVANTVVSGLVVDRILPSQLQNVIVEHVNKLLLKQRIVDNQVNRAMDEK